MANSDRPFLERKEVARLDPNHPQKPPEDQIKGRSKIERVRVVYMRNSNFQKRD